MKCNRCSMSATIHLTNLVDGEIKDLHLCEKCAREHQAIAQPLGLAELLAGLSAFGKIAPAASPDRGTALQCGTCGLKYEDFQKTGRFGCAECYLAFEPHLKQLLQNVHGSVKHSGKVPLLVAPLKTRLRKETAPSQAAAEATAEEEKAPDTIESLRTRLEAAIAEENFEHAAELRDRIYKLEGRTRPK